MLKDGIHGFCMALADSVPGVSGGTIAFIMGFYDRFINSVHDLVFGKKEEKKSAILYLAKLGVGWIIGMAMAVIVLSALFESHIYAVSSLFIGFTAGAIPLVIKEEKESLREMKKGAAFCLTGMILVAGITWANGRTGGASMNLDSFSVPLMIRLFLIGMLAVSAMFLPGISGSTLLLIFGAYIPVITAAKKCLSLDLSWLPYLLIFGLGILAGAATTVKGIKVCLEKFRSQTVYLILGMMIGSFYAIVMGPTTLEVPQNALNPGNFHILFVVIGIMLVLGMNLIKEKGAAAHHGKENISCQL